MPVVKFWPWSGEFRIWL